MRNLPCALVIKETICSLLELLRDCFRLLMPLEPGLILLMESPTLILECLGCQVLLISPLFIVKDVEKRIWIYAGIQSRIIEDRIQFLRVVRRRSDPIVLLVVLRCANVTHIWDVG